MEEEKESQRKIISLSEEKVENNNHLGDKLIHHFSPPLLLAVLGGIVIYAVCSLIFLGKSRHNSQIKNSLFQLNLQLNEQLILQVESLLIYRIQSIFDLLRKIEGTAVFFYGLYKENQVDKVKVGEYITAYTKQINEIDENIERNENKAVIGKNENINVGLDINNDEIKHEIYTFSALIPMMSSMYNSTNLNEEYIENIFIIMNKNELFLDFPLTNDTMFKTGTNRAFCFNELNQQEEKINIPENYDYHCQSWFSDSINLHKISQKDYYISPPYYIQKTSKILISTICLNSTNISSKTDITQGDYYLICINVRYQPILNALELINHKIYGYFFVTRVFNQRAFYYPKSNSFATNTQTFFFDNFNVEEFNLNEDYYLDELNEYMNNRNIFVNIYENLEASSLLEIGSDLKGEFVKNDKKYFYYIFPVFNHLSSDKINLVNIIYIYADETTENIIRSITNKLLNVETLIFLFFIFFIQAIVVMILVNHLIRAIAFNIVLPMKNIKKIFEKFNNEDDGFDKDEDLILNHNSSLNTNSGPREIESYEENKNNRQKHSSFIRSKSTIFGINKRNEPKKENPTHELNKSIPKSNKIEQNMNFIGPIDDNDDFLNNYQDYGSDSDDEENYINIKSKDIQDLFGKMINVKNSLDTVNSEDQNNIKKLPDLLFASEIFGEIKNEKAKNICIANIANIFLKLKKYDLAIMHLVESEISLEKEKINNLRDSGETTSLNSSKISKNKKKSKKKNILIQNRISVNEVKLNKEQMEQKIIEKNKILIENRYPKLIHCYKKFFKNLKKLKKMKLSKQLTKNKMEDYEYYISKNFHMLMNFKEYIEKYIELCQIEGNYLNSNNRYIQALLEKIEFIIKYEINEENNNFNNIEENLDLLHELFIKVKKLIKGNKEITKPKNILKFLLKEELTNDLDEIPNSILMQRLNYLKGNLALKCGHYMIAVKKFQKVFLKSSDKITDIKITVKSYKKLIKIAELMKSKCNYINKKTEENILNQYIIDKTKELKKFVSIERNFIILISTNADNLDFFINSFENAVYIIENYIKGNDRYCIAFASSDTGLGGGMKVIVKLEEKDKQNNDGLINYIQDIKQDYDLLSSYEENGEDDIKYILQKVKIFSNNNERKNFYIFFGNKSRLSHESIEFLCGKEINSFIEEDKEKLILIMHENYETIETKNNDLNSLIPVEEKIFDVNKLNKKLCSYIHFDDIQKIKEDVMIYGNINSLDNYFNFEKYEMKKYD